MRKIDSKLYERDIFLLTTEELEQGERPGWIERSLIAMEGEKVTIYFEVQREISTVKAYWIIVRKRVRAVLEAL